MIGLIVVAVGVVTVLVFSRVSQPRLATPATQAPIGSSRTVGPSLPAASPSPPPSPSPSPSPSPTASSSQGVPRPHPEVIRDVVRSSTLASPPAKVTPANARSELAAGNYSKARAQAEEVLATEPANKAMLDIAAEAACAMKDATAAQTYYERARVGARPRIALACQAAGITLKAPAKKPLPGAALRPDAGT